MGNSDWNNCYIVLEGMVAHKGYSGGSKVVSILLYFALNG